jgi:peptidoglycan hydrolase CwlO-like protein
LNTIEKLEEELNLFKCENNSKNCEIEKLNSETLKLSNQIKEREMIYSDTIDKHEKQLPSFVVLIIFKSFS